MRVPRILLLSASLAVDFGCRKATPSRSPIANRRAAAAAPVPAEATCLPGYSAYRTQTHAAICVRPVDIGDRLDPAGRADFMMAVSRASLVETGYFLGSAPFEGKLFLRLREPLPSDASVARRTKAGREVRPARDRLR